MVLPRLSGVAWAKTRSPRSARLRWWMVRWTPATRWKPEAMWAPMLASPSAMSADTPPWSTLNGWQHLRLTRSRPLTLCGDTSSNSNPIASSGASKPPSVFDPSSDPIPIILISPIRSDPIRSDLI